MQANGNKSLLKNVDYGHEHVYSAWPSWITLALLLPTILILFQIATSLIGLWSSQRAYPFQLDAEEGFILNQAISLAHGQTIYPPIDQPPFLVGNYTPLFPWIYSRVHGATATLASLPLGRLLVELATLACALCLAFIVGWRTRRLLLALLAPLLFLVSYEVFHWSAFVRVDLPALFLTVAGLGVFLTVRHRWGLVLSAALLVAAAYTRQTAVLAPLACAAALLLHDRRRLAWFLVPYAALALIAFSLLQWRTGGGVLPPHGHV